MSKLEELIKQLCPNGVEYKTLGELGKFYGGITGKSKEDFKDGNAKFITYKNVYENISLKLDVEDKVKISEKENQRTLEYGDIIFTGSSETPDECGISSVITKKVEEKLYLNSFCFFFRMNNKEILNPDFAKHLFRSSNLRYQIGKTASGVTRFNVSKKAMEKICIPVPPLEVQCEIVHILDDFTLLSALLSAELSAELKARQKQYEYYLYKLISDSKKITKNKLYELTIWDKKFNAVENYMQPNVKKYPTLLAVDLFNLERKNGNVFLLSTGGQRGWTTEEVAGDNISEGEVVTIPWGKSRPVQEVMKYYCGKFVTGDNRIATSNDIKKLNNKYLFYWMQTQSERIDKFYRGSGIQHPNMRNVLTLEIELPSIDEQKRIVSILDKFEKLCNDISKGLPAEIEARQKQYEYYRDKLLTFKELKVNE